MQPSTCDRMMGNLHSFCAHFLGSVTCAANGFLLHGNCRWITPLTASECLSWGWAEYSSGCRGVAGVCKAGVAPVAGVGLAGVDLVQHRISQIVQSLLESQVLGCNSTDPPDPPYPLPKHPGWAAKGLLRVSLAMCIIPCHLLELSTYGISPTTAAWSFDYLKLWLMSAFLLWKDCCSFLEPLKLPISVLEASQGGWFVFSVSIFFFFPSHSHSWEIVLCFWQFVVDLLTERDEQCRCWYADGVESSSSSLSANAARLTHAQWNGFQPHDEQAEAVRWRHVWQCSYGLLLTQIASTMSGLARKSLSTFYTLSELF